MSGVAIRIGWVIGLIFGVVVVWKPTLALRLAVGSPSPTRLQVAIFRVIGASIIAGAALILAKE